MLSKREQELRNKILDCIQGDKSAYIKDDGSYNVAKIAKDIKSCKKSVKAHLEDIGKTDQLQTKSLF